MVNSKFLFIANLVILVIAAISVMYTTMSFSKEINEIKKTNQEIYESINALKNENYQIYRKIYNLENDLLLINQKINSLHNNITNLKENFIRIEENLRKVEENINKSLNNVSSTLNSILEVSNHLNNWIYKSSNSLVQSRLNSLISESESKCRKGYDTFDLACFYYFIYKIKDFSYAYDNETYGKNDSFVPLETLMNKKKGDCEDYSLFLFYTIKNLQNKYSYIRVPSRPFGYTSNYRYIIYEYPDYYVYFDNAKENIIYIKDKKPYILCFYTTEDVGHCAVALCPKSYKIKNLTEMDLKIFDNCDVIDSVGYAMKYERESAILDKNMLSFYLRYRVGSHIYNIIGVYYVLDDSTICVKYWRNWTCFKFLKK